MASFLRETIEDVRLVARGWRWGRRPLVPRSAEPYVPNQEKSVFPTAWARSLPARVVREAIQTGALGPLLRSEVEPRVNGLDVLDRVEPPVLFVANHASHLDTPLILCTLPPDWRRTTAVAAAADYFFDTWWRATGSAVVFNTFPIERRGGSMSATPGDLLKDGWNVVIFPEGTRSVDGWMGRFRMGAAYLAVAYGVPIVPVAIRGSFAAMPRGRGWPRPGRLPVTVRYGEPLHPPVGGNAREFAPKVRDAIARLLDEDRSTWWEAQRRAANGETPDPTGPPVAQWRRVWSQTAPPRVARPRRAWR